MVALQAGRRLSGRRALRRTRHRVAAAAAAAGEGAPLLRLVGVQQRLHELVQPRARLVRGYAALRDGVVEAGVQLAAFLEEALFVRDDALEFREQRFFFFDLLGRAREQGFGQALARRFALRVEFGHALVSFKFGFGHAGGRVGDHEGFGGAGVVARFEVFHCAGFGCVGDSRGVVGGLLSGFFGLVVVAVGD